MKVLFSNDSLVGWSREYKVYRTIWLSLCFLGILDGTSVKADYFAWRAEHNAASAPLANSDNDELLELNEYAFGLDPHIPEPIPEESLVVTHSDSQDYLHLCFPRRTDVTDLFYEVRAADDPKDLANGELIYGYSSATGTESGAGFYANIGGNPPMIEVTDSNPISSTKRRFMQLTVRWQSDYQFVTIGDPGNNPHPELGQGRVDYAFDMGRHEITNKQYTEFLNAVAKADPNGLYHPEMGSPYNPYGGIQRHGTSPNYSYTTEVDMDKRPVNFVAFYSICRFCNWLQNGKPTGPQSTSTTEDGAYDLQADPIIRKPSAQYFIPDRHEWFKAAYYDPSKEGGPGYWIYPTRSNTSPTIAQADAPGNIINDSNNIANYGGGFGNVTNVGSGGPGSASYYGVFDMAGNVWEWNDEPLDETAVNWLRYSSGGSFSSSYGLEANSAGAFQVTGAGASAIETIGFRIARPAAD